MYSRDRCRQGHQLGTEGSIEVKEGDWFHESETQSAPYWFYIIDGINVISE